MKKIHLILIVVLVIISGGLVFYLTRQSPAKNISNSGAKAPVITKTISGLAQKVEVAADGKSGVLFVQVANGLPEENKPPVVYQIQLDDSVLVSSISPPKSATATKPLTSPLKWKDIKAKKYANIHLNKDLGSATTVKVSTIKDVEIIDN
jgi:hypothetical protein